MLIVLIAEKRIWYSGFGLTILEYSRIVYYSELPIPNDNFCLKMLCLLENYLMSLLYLLVLKGWYKLQSYYSIKNLKRHGRKVIQIALFLHVAA